MSEFSKEELVQILHGLCHANIDDWEVGKKIQTMIKNFDILSKSNHKKIVTGAYPRSNPPKKCKICGGLFYHE